MGKTFNYTPNGTVEVGTDQDEFDHDPVPAFNSEGYFCAVCELPLLRKRLDGPWFHVLVSKHDTE